jgi:hypothetical protein
MLRFLIIVTNCALLALLLIGLPAATREHFGDVQLSSASTGRLVMFWGLGIAAALNIFAALTFIKDRKQRILCWQWAVIFGGLWLADYAFVRGWLNFDWLRRALLWLQKYF